MKKQLLIALIISTSAYKSNAQGIWTPGTGSDVTTHTTGNCTVDGVITAGLATLDGTSPSLRKLSANTNTGILGLYANTYTNNGPGIELYGASHTFAPFQGKIHIASIGDDLTKDAASFVNYTPGTGIYHYNMTLTKAGEMILGGDLGSGLIAPGDVLTVKNAMGFYAAPDNSGRQIHGNTGSGYLGIYSNHSQTDGSSNVEVYGHAHATFPGQVHYNAYGFGGYGHKMQSYGFVGGTPEWRTHLAIKNDGAVVVSNVLPATPTDRLTVRDNIGFQSLTDAGRSINGHAINGSLGIYSNAGPTDGSSNVEVYGHAHPSFDGQVHYNSYGAGTGWGHVFQTYTLSGATATWKQRMVVTKDGRVGIGENIIAAGNMPGNYLLYVEKGILTEKLKVANKGDVLNWSDFVFEKDYNLMPIEHLEDYILKNKHLPEIPSTEEVVRDGIDVGMMEARLLQKIEELTLYVIQQQKQLTVQQREIEHLKTK
jgi:hypothetical protein